MPPVTHLFGDSAASHETVITVVRERAGGGLSDRMLQDEILPFLRANMQISACETLADDEAYDIYSPETLEEDKRKHLETEWYARFPKADIFIQSVKERGFDIFLSDMDSTMIEQECIDEIAYALDIGELVSAVTERAMRGELDFTESLRKRVSLLKDAPVSLLEEVYEKRIRPSPGADILVQTLKKHGVHCVLVSGGFTFFAERVAAKLGFDAYHANMLEAENGALTGGLEGAIVCAQTKADLLTKYGKERAAARTAAAGDGANDIPMLQAAGAGIAYKAKPAAEEAARFRLRYNSLKALLYMAGYPADMHA